jgi:ribonuclease HIII
LQVTNVVQIKDVDESVLDEIEKFLGARFGLVADSTNKKGNYYWQIKTNGCSATAYKSGKIVLQGEKKKLISEVVAQLNRKFNKDTAPFVPHIGVDEAGKGDFFGGLVVAGVFVSDFKIRDELLSAGVRDSKTLRNSQAIELKDKILNLCRFVDIINIYPSKYNQLYKKFRNVNKLLAWGHARVIENLLEKIPKGVCEKAIIDQFSKSKARVRNALMDKGRLIELEQRHKGESDIAVAAGSIVARGIFLESMKDMNNQYDFEFPLGASNVIDAGRKFVEEFSPEKLSEVAKVSFRTSQKVLA